jgi:hypothetical protein
MFFAISSKRWLRKPNAFSWMPKALLNKFIFQHSFTTRAPMGLPVSRRFELKLRQLQPKLQ